MQNAQTTEEVADLIMEALAEAAEEQDLDLTSATYREAGVLTADDGLVVTIGDAEFQVTVVRSR